jgi:3-hydroxybutyryl-CoA dehydrogenase
MGSGIAEVAAKAGCSVIVHEANASAAEAAQGRIEKSLQKAVIKAKLTQGDMEAALGRIQLTNNLEEMSDRQIVIEAVTENESLKKQIFSRLDGVMADPDAILASNTSSIPITRLASATGRPHSVVGMHFFNPVHLMPLMELVTTMLTSPEVAERAKAFASDTLGKTVINAKDRGGFIVNLLLVPYLLGAVRMYEAGIASREDIDTGMRLGASHPMGPLELCDFIGLDTMKLVADVLFEEYKEPFYAAPPQLVRMVEAGFLGRKTGKGFYQYS